MYEPKKRPRQSVREIAPPYAANEAGWVPAGDFKTHCLQLIEQVRQERGEVVITRYGRPVAKLVPFEESPVSMVGYLAGSVTAYGDLISPIDEEWDADA
ncbi:MAG TPA: type II toxin-antitoxin system Phd/YefM family antitoxin [Longimicrobium sp.]|jgi:prevent-host-death family protein